MTNTPRPCPAVHLRAAGLCLALSPFAALAQPSTGPDIAVGDVVGVTNYPPLGGIDAVALGNVVCNPGDAPVPCFDGASNQHPIAFQHLYRLKNGRFEQIGQSWGLHGFCYLRESQCDTCIPFGPFCDYLGVGCSSPDTSDRNGSQGGLGPKHQINATTGVFPFPSANPAFSGPVARRLQFAIADALPAQNPGALYFAEVHIISPHDAQADNGLNNTSHRRSTFTANSNGSVNMSYAGTGPAVPLTPILQAWRTHGLGLNTPDPDITPVPLDYTERAPGNIDITARFWAAAKASENPDGTWHYEYAFHNLNSHRSARAVSVPLPEGVTATNPGFHDVAYHSGEPFDGTDWTPAITPASIAWSTQTFEENENANALRWGTVYNVRFDADAPPTTGPVTLTLFRPGAPGDPDTLTATLPIPGAPCAADWSGDGALNSDDYFAFLSDFFNGDADFNNDGTTNSDDYFAFLDAFFEGC